MHGLQDNVHTGWYGMLAKTGAFDFVNVHV